jgi:U3 small nucleolar RNA-associated protein 7
VLTYQDTSTGQQVAQHRTKMGPCSVMRQNAWNGVLALGHGNGTVSMWTPSASAPVLKMLCHYGPLRAVAVDGQGQHMVTAGADSAVKVCS